ncbi:MAG: HD-GYP domain-containing protein [Dehalococcoidales bacterium]|nr:HD-GYP domain-containing protein [Dehalococcoidales bacterium]
MVLGKTLYNDRGDVLLQRGVALTEGYVETLYLRGFRAICISDGDDDDLAFGDPVSERTQAVLQQHVRGMFALAACATAQHNPSPRLPTQALERYERLARDVEHVIDEVLESDVLDGMVSLKSHDNYSFCHSVDVTIAGLLIGKRLWLERGLLRQLAQGCLLHDIGKLAIDEKILNKEGPLNAREWAEIRSHPEAGYGIISRLLPEDGLLARHIILQHHERQDGLGYPRGLAGTNKIAREGLDRYDPHRILLIAEIAAVADVYSAMASDRPYRPALSPEEIVRSLEEMAGSHLNREIVQQFLSILPPFPMGTWVVVQEGPWRGYAGIVVHQNEADLAHPVVRMLQDPGRRRLEPFELDTAADAGLQVSSCSPTPGAAPMDHSPEAAG